MVFIDQIRDSIHKSSAARDLLCTAISGEMHAGPQDPVTPTNGRTDWVKLTVPIKK
tara:strand:- start:471 stop:638 length:168 start_codon:yes stop_codon:yes gene_type:complete